MDSYKLLHEAEQLYKLHEAEQLQSAVKLQDLSPLAVLSLRMIILQAVSMKPCCDDKSMQRREHYCAAALLLSTSHAHRFERRILERRHNHMHSLC